MKSIDSRINSETVRLAALNLSLNAFFGYNESDQNSQVFSKLSYKAKHANVSHSSVTERLEKIISTSELSLSRYSIDSLTILEFTELIARIHYIGSFRNPFQSFADQRFLGAYYTPTNVADYIVERTIKPLLDERVKVNDGLCKEILDELRILDPACGPGVFLLSAFRFMEQYFRLHKGSTVDVERLGRCFYGVDLDVGSLEIAAVSISLMQDSTPRKLTLDNFGSRLKSGNSLIGLEKNMTSEFFSDTHYPFQWNSEFPDVFSGKSQGFDIILFNPPYKSLKPNLAEYIRENLVDGYREIHLEKYTSYKNHLLENIAYFKNSGEYEFSNKYTINTYRLFIERSLQLLRNGGRIGFVVPSTLLGDLSALPLRKEILSSYQWHFINEFPESAQIFPGVTQSLCISSIGKNGPTEDISVRFGLGSIENALTGAESRLLINNVREVMGPFLQIPRVQQKDWKTLRLLHKYDSIQNIPWIKNHRGEFDLTLDKKFISPDGTNSLVRGTHIGRYLLRGQKTDFETIDVDGFLHERKGSLRTKHIALPRIACQQISNQLQRWRIKFSMIQQGAVLANSCNYIVFGNNMDSKYYHYLLGLLNSELLNWRFSVSSTNNHISNGEIGRLPIPNPFENSEDVKEIIRSVRSIREPSHSVVPKIEASVARLYNIPASDLKRILRIQGVSTSETELILAEMQ